MHEDDKIELYTCYMWITSDSRVDHISVAPLHTYVVERKFFACMD